MIRFENVSKKYAGAATDAVIDLNLHIREGEICMLVGPSGCGKTTTMKMINKLIEPTSGRIFIDGKNINEIDTIELRLNTGYIIQDIGLFPHMTVAENIATVPNELGWKKDAIRARIDELLDLVDLNPDKYRNKKPKELSGGQKQRVGVARALAANPKIMLMDEPFGALDTITRAKLQDEFLKIQEKIKKTIVFVTHDIDEAIKMGDKIAVLKEGRVVQVGTSMEILLHPADPFVSELLGGKNTLKIMNLIPCGILMTNIGDFRKGSVPGSDIFAGTGRVGMKTTAQEALSEMFRTGESYILVADENNKVQGVVTLDTMMKRVSQYGKTDE